jgi:hypothetical protein
MKNKTLKIAVFACLGLLSVVAGGRTLYKKYKERRSPEEVELDDELRELGKVIKQKDAKAWEELRKQCARLKGNEGLKKTFLENIEYFHGIFKNADKEKLRNIIQEGLISDMSTDSFKEAMEIAISEKYGRKIENSPAYKEFVEFYIAMAKKERMFTLNQAIDEYKLEKQDDNKTIQEQG